MSGASPTLLNAITAATGAAASAAASASNAAASATAAAVTAASISEIEGDVSDDLATVSGYLATVQSNSALVAQSLVTVQGTQALILNEASNLNTTVANAAVLVGEAQAAVTTLNASLATAAASASSAAASDADAITQAATATTQAGIATTQATSASSSASAAAASAASIAGGPVASVIGYTGIVTAADIFTSPALLGTPTAPTPSPGDNSTAVSTTAFVTASFSPILSPTFTGSPAAPTPTANDNSTRIATTAYVIGQASSSTPVMDSTGAAGSSLSWARADHVHPSDTSRMPTAGGALSGSIGFAPIATVASASTVNFGAAASNVCLISGTNTITSFGSTAVSGYTYMLSFGSALTLTNSSALVLPGGANIITAAGDTCFAVCQGSGNWTVPFYQRKTGQVIVPLTMALMPADAITDVIAFFMPNVAAVGGTLQGWRQVPFPCTIQSVTMLADQSGSITIDIWKCTYAQYSPGTHPVVGDSICASAVPAISSGTKYTDSNLIGWTKTINAGDILAFNVKVLPTNITEVAISLQVLKS